MREIKFGFLNGLLGFVVLGVLGFLCWKVWEGVAWVSIQLETAFYIRFAVNDILNNVAVLFIVSFMLTVIGWILGTKVFKVFQEKVLQRIPIIATFIKLIPKNGGGLDSVTDGRTGKEVLLHFSDGLNGIGLVTKQWTDPKTGNKVCNVYIACSPFPFTGYVFRCEDDERYITYTGRGATEYFATIASFGRQ